MVKPKDDGCVNVTLAKKWNKKPEGSIIRVDPVRAEWLSLNGFVKANNPKRRQ